MERRFGVEIEAYGIESRRLAQLLTDAGVTTYYAGYTHTTRSTWKIVPDASLPHTNSFELVSPPLQGEDGLAQLKTVCRVLNENGANVSRYCGLHVHVDAEGLSFQRIRNVVKLLVKYEGCMDQLVAHSRRGDQNYYCRSVRSAIANHLYCDPSDLARIFDRINRTTSTSALWALMGGNRYRKINLDALSRHRTIEFRQHNGTTNYEKIAAWVGVAVGMVERGAALATIKLNGSDDFEHFLRSVPARFRRALRARRDSLTPEPNETQHAQTAGERVMQRQREQGERIRNEQRMAEQQGNAQRLAEANARIEARNAEQQTAYVNPRTAARRYVAANIAARRTVLSPVADAAAIERAAEADRERAGAMIEQQIDEANEATERHENEQANLTIAARIARGEAV